MHESSDLATFDINFQKTSISLVFMIPHKIKAYICILNLSFHMRMKHKLFKSVNSQTNKQTNKQTKAESMVQLGIALRRSISTMVDHHDLDLPVLFSKLDIKDGLWRMAVINEDAWNFCYFLPLLNPVYSIDNIEIVVPNSLNPV